MVDFLKYIAYILIGGLMFSIGVWNIEHERWFIVGILVTAFIFHCRKNGDC